MAFNASPTQFCGSESDEPCPGTTSKCRNSIEVGDPDVVVDPPTPSYDFQVQCPITEQRDLGTFNCTNLSEIPAIPTTVREAANYGIVIGDKPCGIIIVSASDNATANTCNKVNGVLTDQEITRTITILDDKNGNKTYDEGEQQTQCTFT